MSMYLTTKPFRFDVDALRVACFCTRPDSCQSCLVQRHIKSYCRTYVLARIDFTKQMSLFGGVI